MSQKFLTNVELEAGLVDGSNSTGTSGFLLSSTGSATSWIDPAAVSVGESEQVHIACKNTSGVAISKGDPVYITGTVGTSFIIQIAKADASDSAKMPAVGLAETDLANNAEGFVIVSGVLKNLTTDPLSTGDGTPSSNDTVYVKVGGGLTRTKPTGASNLIQNVGKVGRVQGTSAGSLAVSTIMRTNDVPNLNTGKIWVGSSTYTAESGVVHLDESQGRMGINKTSLSHALDVSGTIATDSGFLAVATQPSLSFIDASGGGSVYTSAGSMYFNTGVGSPTVKMAILSGGNVGIGATSPSQKLHVGGNIRVTGAYYDSNNSAGTSGQVLSSTATGTDWVSVSDLPTDTRYVAVIGDTMTGTLTMSNAQIQINDSGVQARLNLNNTGTGNPQINFQLGGSSKFTVGVDNNDSDKFKISAGSALGSSDRIVVDSSGNVGIGTTSPAAGYLLDVNGLGAFNTAVSIQGIDTGNPTAANEEIRLSGFGVMGSRTSFYVTNANASGGIYFGIGGAHNANNKALINSSGISAPRYSDIDNSAFYLEPGSGATGQWKVQTPSGYVSIGPNNTSWAHFYTDRSNGYFFDKRIVADSGTFASYNENLTLQAPYNTTRMTINSSNGNVGINNTSPSAKLHVGGSTDQTAVLKIEAGDNTGFPATTSELRMIGYGSRGQGVFFEDTSNSGEEWFAGLNYGSSWDRYSIGYDASGGQAEYIANAILTVIGSTGRVGIGTTSPGSKLHVSGAIQNDEFTIPNTAGTSGQVLAWPATGTTLEWSDAGGGGGASELNDLSDCETTSTSVYVANVPASNSGNDNTVLGINAANNITSGSNNTIIGNSAAPVMTTQSHNVIIGADACFADTTPGNGAVVVGSLACYNEASVQQVAIGNLASFTDGAIGGVSIGYTAGYSASASYAINVGSQAGYKSGGIGGVNIGYQAGYNSSASGSYNVSLGYKAGYSITTGDDNVSIGKNANDASSVSDTVVIGAEAGGNGAADGAIYIGRTAANKSGAYGSGVDSIVIGHLAAASSSTAANEVTISPDQGTTNARFDAGDTAWSFSSDARLKENVEDLELGLDFIDQIQPRTFDWKKSGEKSSGFIAQELLEVVENNNADYTSIVNTDDAECYTVAQAALVPILVNAIKELKAEIDILKSKQ